MKVIRGCSVFTRSNISISFEGGLIKEVKNLENSEELAFISPGFMDTQVNGLKGLDYCSEKLTQEDVVVMAEMLAASGTTCHFPTIVTSSRDITTNNLKKINSALSKYPELNAAIGGIHIEGPYISSEDGARGAHNLNFVRNPDYDEFLEWQNALGGRIRQLTLAPERTGAIKFIKRVTSDGIIVSIGHTAASPEIIKTAVHVEAGMSTHLGNGNHSMIPRLKNYIWEQLASDNLHASISTDGFHLPSSVVKVILRAKTLDQIILVSNAAVSGGMINGTYKWEDIDVEVYIDGHQGLAGTEYLAGARHLLDHSLAWLMNEIKLSPEKAVSLCTINTYKLFFPRISVPGLKAGDPADITLFNWKRGDQRLNILKTWRAGEKVYSA